MAAYCNVWKTEPKFASAGIGVMETGVENKNGRTYNLDTPGLLPSHMAEAEALMNAAFSGDNPMVIKNKDTKPGKKEPKKRKEFKFKIGDKVIHTATGIEMIVINYGREQLECRTFDLRTAWMYEHELSAIDK